MLRDDRILDEAHATGGDIRRLCDLFGLSVQSTYRYVATVGNPALEALAELGHAEHRTP